MEEYKCIHCDKILGSMEALEMHNNAKHTEKKEERKPVLNKRKIKSWGIVIVILGLLIYGGIYLGTNSQDCLTAPANEMNIGGHQNAAMHIHPDLRIDIMGNIYLIPGEIGLGSGLMRPIHTHDATGHVHVESPCARTFTIGEFFEVWGETFNEQCIFDNCVDDRHELIFKINGEENPLYQDYTFVDGDQILIEYVEI